MVDFVVLSSGVCVIDVYTGDLCVYIVNNSRNHGNDIHS